MHGNKGKKRKPFSEEWKRRMSEAHKGIGLGIPKTKEHRKKIGDARRGKYVGEKSSSWRGDDS